MPGWDTTQFNDSAWSPVVTGLNTVPSSFTNVTDLVASYISNQRLNFVVNNGTLGGDPANNAVKTLRLTFRVDGGTNQTVMYPEYATVNLGGTGQTLTLVQALYGNAAFFPDPGRPQLQAAVTDPSRCLETLPATQLTEPKPGCYTFDLGQNMVGWVRLTISGNVGDRITVRHGEMLNPDGTVYTANLRGATATDFYILGTNGVSSLEPRFTFHGFRYVEVRGLSVPPTLSSVTGLVVHSALARTGAFACSNPQVNQLYSNIIWGQKGNYLETPTDCPQRDERLGWAGDAEFFVPTAAYNFDVQSFFRRYLVALCDDAQGPYGGFDSIAPTIGGEGGTAWGDAAWICPYNMYRSYGDTNVIADHYAELQFYGQHLTSYVSNFVMGGRPGDFGDWLNLGGGASTAVLGTAYYAYFAQAMSEMAAAIGRSADAAAYATLHSNVVAAFATFFNADGSFKDGSNQTGYALAFSLGLVPEGLRAAAAQQFANSIAQFDNHLATGFIGTPRLLPGLHAAGRDDLAYTLLLQQTYPSWLYQVGLGATTMWERWDGWTPSGGFQSVGMNSFNHYAFGSVGQFLYSGVGGINPASPGYQSILIQPVPGSGLTWANTSYQATHGLISTAWTNTGHTFHLDVVIPPNTTAQVYVPTTNAAAITESGLPATNAPGVSFVGLTNGYARFAVGSGHYVWASPLQEATLPGSDLLISTTNQSGSLPFTPSWGLMTNGSLIAAQLPVSASGNFNQEPNAGNRSVGSLTDGGSLTISQVATVTSPNYVTCGDNAGTSVTYTLTGASSGYDLTNITVYGGWQDKNRDQQAYTVYYSTVAAPTVFTKLATVNYNPSAPSGVASATRVTLTASGGVLAAEVAALKFDFSTPASEYGYCGYAEITVFGNVSPAPSVTLSLLASTGTGTMLLRVDGLSVGHEYSLQSTTNLAAPIWSTRTNLVATETGAAFALSTTNHVQEFYRVVGH